MNKQGQLRINWGGLDIISAVLAILGIIALNNGSSGMGWILIIVAIIKQFSGR